MAFIYYFLLRAHKNAMCCSYKNIISIIILDFDVSNILRKKKLIFNFLCVLYASFY